MSAMGGPGYVIVDTVPYTPKRLADSNTCYVLFGKQKAPRIEDTDTCNKTVNESDSARR